MHEQPAFNQENQDPDWKKVVIVWNGNHAKRNENEFFSGMCSLVLQYIIQFGSHTSHHAQICWNVMQVMQILVKCQNHLKIRKKNGSKIRKKHYRGSPIAFTCIMQVIYIIQFTMDNCRLLAQILPLPAKYIWMSQFYSLQTSWPTFIHGKLLQVITSQFHKQNHNARL